MDTMSYEQKLEKGQGGYFRQKKIDAKVSYKDPVQWKEL